MGECTEDEDDEFFIRKKYNGFVVTKTCGWLESKNKGYKNYWCKNGKSGEGFGSAKEVCKETCDTCPKPTPAPTISSAPSICAQENDDDEFFLWRGKVGTCGWLKTRYDYVIERICRKRKVKGDIPPAWQVCVETCETCIPNTVSPAPSMSPSVSKAPSACTEDDEDEFLHYMWFGKPITMTCSELQQKRDWRKKWICKSELSFEDLKPAKEVCLVTCEICEE